MLVQLQGPPLSNPTCLPTCIYFSYIYCIHHLPTSPTSYSTAHATTRPPPLLLTPGVHHTPRWPRLRRPASAPPRPAVKEPDNGHRDPDRRPLRLPQTPAKETYDFLPSSHFPCLASWIVCALARPLLTTAARMRSTASTLLILTALTTIVSAVSVPLFASQGTHHAPKAAAPLP